MAGQQKIQEYLQRHKIGALFEELMGKVVVDQPDDPIRHLITLLQKKLDRKSTDKTALSKSVTLSGAARMRSGSPDRAKLAASFAGEKLISDKEKQHSKPWLVEGKSTKLKVDAVVGFAGSKKTVQKPTDKTSKSDLPSFDDIFETATGPSKKLTSAAPVAAAAAVAAVVASSGQPGDFGVHPAFTHFQNSVTQVMIINRVQDELIRRHGLEEDELISAEVPISIRTVTKVLVPEMKTDADSWKPETSTANSSQSINRFSKGQKANSVSHKKKLEEVVLQLQQQQKTSDFSDDSGYDDLNMKDSAIELLEDVELLRQEGATNVKSSGVVIRHVPSVDVKVSICARCAKFLEGDVSQSSPVADLAFGKRKSSSREMESTKRPDSARSASSPLLPATSGRHSTIEAFLGSSMRRSPSPGPFESDDEEFESVSQVNGPRHPVWKDEDKEITTRKGSLSQTGATSKAEHHSSRSDASVGRRSSVNKALPLGTDAQPNKSLSARSSKHNSKGNSSDEENIISSLTRNSSQWTVQDYDTDGSTIYVTGGARSTTKNYKPRAY